MSTRTALMIGDTVDLRIATKYLPNQTGAPIELPNRHGGKLLEWNQYGNAEVLWPNGDCFSYEAGLLVRTPGANALVLGKDES